MKSYSWTFDPQKGDYIITNGSPTKDTSLLFAAYVRLKVLREKWMYAPDNSYGSEFGNLKKRSRDSRFLSQSLAESALKPLIDDGRAKSITVTQSTTLTSRNQENFDILIIDAEGQSQTFTLSPVGL